MKRTIEDSFKQYSAAVLQSRALVDVRDCLKPSARQIFYALETDKFVAGKPFKKTLKAIGSASRFYIHGDSSAEGVIMRAGQPFAMRYPLVEVEGSYGNLMESGNWAAPRYTSARLSQLSTLLFADIKKDTITDWRDNYDDTEQYPSVLPSKGFYNLVNGTFGIGIGASSSIPQFNIRDLNAALIHLLRNPDCDFEDVYCAPDFATGGLLINEAEVKEALKAGTGKSCKIRSRIEYNDKEKCLVVTEIPFSVYTNTICKELEGLIQSEENPGIERFNDLTGQTPLIKIYLKGGVSPEKVIRFLYKTTSLQYYFGINFTMLDNGRFPKVFTWKETLQAHLNHEIEVYRRGFNFDLQKIKDRLHIIDGLLKAIDMIDEVIKTIKASKSTSDANLALQKLLEIDDIQAKAILDIKLARLAHLEITKLVDEKSGLEQEKTRIETILADEELFKNEVAKGYEEVAKKYGDERRTQISNISSADETDEEVIEPEACMVVLTEAGTVKRIPSSQFKTQKRAGKGVKTQEDITTAIIRTNTVDSLMVFTSLGRAYRISVNDIPVGTNVSRGISVKALCEMAEDEVPQVIYSMYKDTTAKYVMFITKNGLIKKTALEEYTKTRSRKNGISAINIKEGDSLATVTLVNDEEILILTKQGYILRCSSNDVPTTGRVAAGCKGVGLHEGDEVLTLLAIRNKLDDLAILTTNGNGKRIKLEELPLQKRAGMGSKCGNGLSIAAATLVSDEDTLLVVGDKTSICVSAKELPRTGKGALGNMIIKGSKVAGVSKV